MKIAIVHDWLPTMRGGEKVLEAICEAYPDADLYTLYCLKENISQPIKKRKIVTSFIQSLPFSKQNFRVYLPLFPYAIERFNLTGYDLVISTSHCVAKGVITGPNTLHICYCHTPMRYIWDFENDYFNSVKSSWIAKKIINALLSYLRKWDKKTALRVNKFIANSTNTHNKIKRYYGRESIIIYPPVETEYFNLNDEQKGGNYFLIVSALVPYKKTDIIIESFNKLYYNIKIVGDGALRKSLQKRANSNIEFLGWVDKNTLRSLYQNCKALIFPQEEDFGIAALEAQACGKPVIAYAKGGALETVIDKKTGLFFYRQTSDSLINAIDEFKGLKFNANLIRENALRFNNKEAFKEKIKNLFCEDEFTSFKNALHEEIV